MAPFFLPSIKVETCSYNLFTILFDSLYVLDFCFSLNLSILLQRRVELTIEKVYLALETVGLTAEKTKLENDCREGATELKTTDVSVSTLLLS